MCVKIRPSALLILTYLSHAFGEIIYTIYDATQIARRGSFSGNAGNNEVKRRQFGQLTGDYPSLSFRLSFNRSGIWRRICWCECDAEQLYAAKILNIVQNLFILHPTTNSSITGIFLS
ncbi:hypothetical protein DFH11DRAFT_394869 [Phellopilus nigrolimitatus]|nr:hypothetical protein DFH11DRAFT_394869 [Phellopilus nigrolimitatus]